MTRATAKTILASIPAISSADLDITIARDCLALDDTNEAIRLGRRRDASRSVIARWSNLAAAYEARIDALVARRLAEVDTGSGLTWIEIDQGDLQAFSGDGQLRFVISMIPDMGSEYDCANIASYPASREGRESCRYYGIKPTVFFYDLMPRDEALAAAKALAEEWASGQVRWRKPEPYEW